MARRAHKEMPYSPPFTPPNLRDSTRWRGLRIGLLGGTFNPAHKGHRHIARIALARLNLDFIWWLVTPDHPLKSKADIMPYDKRFQSVVDLIHGHPKMMATHLERMLCTRYTYDTVQALMTHYPQTNFTFICGMDNARIFHKWDRWRDLATLMPIAFIARPPAGGLVKNCPLRMLSGTKTKFIKTTKMIDISSTQIRNRLKTND